tara:strand:- start:314 stop:796 length:483 start_codon:yes stop_codon:yes gene_type:complete
MDTSTEIEIILATKTAFFFFGSWIALRAYRALVCPSRKAIALSTCVSLLGLGIFRCYELLTYPTPPNDNDNVILPVVFTTMVAIMFFSLLSWAVIRGLEDARSRAMMPEQSQWVAANNALLNDIDTQIMDVVIQARTPAEMPPAAVMNDMKRRVAAAHNR